MDGVSHISSHHVPAASRARLQASIKEGLVVVNGRFSAELSQVEGLPPGAIAGSLRTLAAQLDPAQFWQVHRSTIVNLNHLDSTRRDDASRLFVRIKGHAVELPVSRAYVHLFKAM